MWTFKRGTCSSSLGLVPLLFHSVVTSSELVSHVFWVIRSFNWIYVIVCLLLQCEVLVPLLVWARLQISCEFGGKVYVFIRSTYLISIFVSTGGRWVVNPSKTHLKDSITGAAAQTSLSRASCSLVVSMLILPLSMWILVL